MPNTVPASAPALPNVIPFPRAADERFLPIIIDSNRVLISAAENKALRDAVSFLALDHEELVSMAKNASTEEEQALRWQTLGMDLTASRLSILVDLLAEARHRLAVVREVSRG